MDLWRPVVSAVRRPPSAVRRPLSAVRRPDIISETLGPIHIKFGTNIHQANRPRRFFQILDSEPQKYFFDQKLTKNDQFHILSPRKKSVQSNYLSFGTNNPSDPMTLHPGAHVGRSALSGSFWGLNLTWGLMVFSLKSYFLIFPSVTFFLNRK